MNNKLLFSGTIFEIYNSKAYNPSAEKFILADCHEKGFVFQVICITGYHAGALIGFIENESSDVVENKKAITYDYFILSLGKLFEEINIKTLKFIVDE